MKILINDHAGHPFQIQLSKELANRGYSIIHTYSASYESPRGNLSNTNPNLNIKPIVFREFNKYSIFDRGKYEANYANEVIKVIKQTNPDILVFSNNPLVSQDKIQEYCVKNNIKFVVWCQDIRSIALSKILKKKNRVAGFILGAYFKMIEKKHLKNSAAIINITDDFIAVFNKWGIDAAKQFVIPNWAPIDELPVIPKKNKWSSEFKVDDKFCIIYSGTLGLKHNPQLLSELAIKMKEYKDVQIIVISEGFGAKFLNEERKKNDLDNLLVLPFQDFEAMPMILGASDVLVAVLEADAGEFSVPSKVLTYLCAQKPIVLSVPLQNLSSKIVKSANAGLCASPDDLDSFINSVKELYNNPDEAKLLGKNGRFYAESNFDIAAICEKFESIFVKLTPSK
jgi:colanic acid biosynthesis glycosyl transferase WcaI